MYCFLVHFLDVSTDARFEVYEDPGREERVKKLRIKDNLNYMSFMSDSESIYGKSVSTLQKLNYCRLEHKQVRSKDKREVRYAPKLKTTDVWSISASKLEIMGKRVALKT